MGCWVLEYQSIESERRGLTIGIELAVEVNLESTLLAGHGLGHDCDLLFSFTVHHIIYTSGSDLRLPFFLYYRPQRLHQTGLVKSNYIIQLDKLASPNYL